MNNLFSRLIQVDRRLINPMDQKNAFLNELSAVVGKIKSDSTSSPLVLFSNVHYANIFRYLAGALARGNSLNSDTRAQIAAMLGITPSAVKSVQTACANFAVILKRYLLSINANTSQSSKTVQTTAAKTIKIASYESSSAYIKRIMDLNLFRAPIQVPKTFADQFTPLTIYDNADDPSGNSVNVVIKNRSGVISVVTLGADTGIRACFIRKDGETSLSPDPNAKEQIGRIFDEQERRFVSYEYNRSDQR
jgi:hypothetical protein